MSKSVPGVCHGLRPVSWSEAGRRANKLGLVLTSKIWGGTLFWHRCCVRGTDLESRGTALAANGQSQGEKVTARR